MTPRQGTIVTYDHPDWGLTTGRVLRTDGEPGYVLVQDLSPHGAREWWPVAALSPDRGVA